MRRTVRFITDFIKKVEEISDVFPRLFFVEKYAVSKQKRLTSYRHCGIILMIYTDKGLSFPRIYVNTRNYPIPISIERWQRDDTLSDLRIGTAV